MKTFRKQDLPQALDNQATRQGTVNGQKKDEGGQRRISRGGTEDADDECEKNLKELHTRQLDYLYTKLNTLKENMKEKQTCLARVRYTTQL